MAYKFYWEHTKTGGARLLRAFGSSGEIVLPAELAGYPLTELGSYCFAPDAHLPEHYEVCSLADEPQSSDGGEWLAELSGGRVESVMLPGSVKKIGNLAFYNCTALKVLKFGHALEEIGSDAFMNCRSLHHMWLCGEEPGSCQRPSGIRRILAQISSDMEVTFGCGGKPEAVLLFPEYSESYDEVAPAHLFGRNIEGEGFRARQCFSDGVADFVQYDGIFPKACAEESEQTLCRLAENRLRYPIDLRADAKERYRTYLRTHVWTVCQEAVRERGVERLLFLCEEGLVCREELEKSIRLASKLEWAEGAAELLRLTERFFPREQKKERYSFDDF